MTYLMKNNGKKIMGENRGGKKWGEKKIDREAGCMFTSTAGLLWFKKKK